MTIRRASRDLHAATIRRTRFTRRLLHFALVSNMDTDIVSILASVNTQFSIAVHVLAAIAHHEGVFTSEILAGSVNANPVFVKRILVKLSKAKLLTATVGKSGGYGLARSPKSISLLDIYSAVNPPDAFAIHAYPKTKECVVSCNIKEIMSEVLVGTQEAVRRELRQTTLADVVSKIRARSG